MNQTTPKREKGQALVEFALTIPILLMFILGIIDLARILFAFSQMMDASRQGVRYGIVDGIETGLPQYLDCAGIRTAAMKVPGLVNMSNTTVRVYYEHPEGGSITECRSGLTVWDIRDGDVLVVEVTGAVRPITPVLLAFTDSIPVSYASRRTIVAEGAAYTHEWPEPPAAPASFSATVDCSRATNNVSFTWTPLSPIPDRAEIRNSLSGQVVVVLDNVEPGLVTNAYCNNCATIAQEDGFGMYYLVAYKGSAPSEMAGPPSTDATVSCSGAPAGSGPETGGVNITGTVFYDKNGNGSQGGNESGISNVNVRVVDAGNDGSLGTSDDKAYSQVTTTTGNYNFTGLSVPYGLSGQVFSVVVDRSSPSLGSKLPTGPYTTTTSPLANGQTFTAAFGFDDP